MRWGKPAAISMVTSWTYTVQTLGVGVIRSSAYWKEIEGGEESLAGDGEGIRKSEATECGAALVAFGRKSGAAISSTNDAGVAASPRIQV